MSNAISLYKAVKKDGKKTRKAIKALTEQLAARDHDDKVAADLNKAAETLKGALPSA